MRRTSLALLALVGFVLAGASAFHSQGSAAQTPDQPAGIRVRGQGVLTVAPDVGVLSIGISVRRPTPSEAIARLANRVEALSAVLLANGVPERDVRTQGLSLNQETLPRNRNEDPIVVVWRARQGFTVRLRDFDRLSATLDAALNALGEEAELQGIFFQIEDTNALVNRARELAVADAKDRAEKLAAQFGVRVGRLIYVQEISTPPVTPVQGGPQATARPATPAPALLGAAAPPVQVAPGEQTISVVIEAIFAVE